MFKSQFLGVEKKFLKPRFTLDPNLLLYLSFHHILGSTTYDVSGQGNNGTIYGASKTPSRIGQALSFDGIDDYVGTGKSLLNNMGKFTLLGWIYPRSSGSRVGFFGQNDCVEFGFSTASIIQAYTQNGGYIEWSFTSETFPLNTWHQVAVVGHGNVSPYLELLADGESKVTGGVSTENYGSSSYSVNIGGGGIWDATGNWFDGIIDEVRIYNRALSQAEIVKIMNAWGI